MNVKSRESAKAEGLTFDVVSAALLSAALDTRFVNVTRAKTSSQTPTHARCRIAYATACSSTSLALHRMAGTDAIDASSSLPFIPLPLKCFTALNTFGRVIGGNVAPPRSSTRNTQSA